MNLLQELEAEQVAKLAANRPVPPFQPGDTVKVSVRVVEGERERVQAFEGVFIAPQGEGTYLLYIDLHLIHEVTTPQAFEGLRAAGRKVRRPDATIAVCDHNIPTSNRKAGIDEPESKLQVDTLEQNVRDFGVPYFPIDSINQGIVHIIGPEQGLSQPGMTIVCGDSHTATHGALGALAFGIGHSEAEA